ncbi:MAG: cytochrome c biogenesis CcdA family protein, partial [Candidatus Micrarchaeota archaeon]
MKNKKTNTRANPLVLLLSLLALISLATISYAGSNKTQLYFFYSQTCTHCLNIDGYINHYLLPKYPSLNVTRLETDIGKNQIYLQALCKYYSIPTSKCTTPMVFIGDKYLFGDGPIQAHLEEEVQKCLERECGDPLAKADVRITVEDIAPSPYLVLLAALVDSINPCAFAVMIFLLTYLTAVGAKARALKIGLAYIAAVYVTYFLAGVGILTTIKSFEIVMVVYVVMAFLAIIAGLVNIKDFFFYGKWFSLEIPARYKPMIEGYVYRASLPAALALAVLVSLVELPCTGGVYFAILSMLALGSTQTAVLYLLFYNAIFVLPLVVILILFNSGYTAERMEEWRLGKRKYMKLLMGIVMIALGMIMLKTINVIN